jgi:hypothetical protein
VVHVQVVEHAGQLLLRAAAVLEAPGRQGGQQGGVELGVGLVLRLRGARRGVGAGEAPLQRPGCFALREAT